MSWWIAIGGVAGLAVVLAVVRWALKPPPSAQAVPQPPLAAPLPAIPRSGVRSSPKWEQTAPFLDSLATEAEVGTAFQETSFLDEDDLSEKPTGFADTRVLDEDEAPLTHVKKSPFSGSLLHR